jgi:hypothetical protein
LLISTLHPLIKLSEIDDVVLEAWYVEYTDELDLFASLAGECHDPTPLNWDDETIVEPYSTLYRMIELGEGRRSPGHVARCSGVEVPALNLVGVAISSQKHMCGRLVQMKALLR